MSAIADVWALEDGQRVRAERCGDTVLLTIYEADHTGAMKAERSACITDWRWKQIVAAMERT
jgi:hypothetical protein